jgi:hypothetical protein
MPVLGMHIISIEEQAFTAPSKWEEVKAKDLLQISLATGIQDKSKRFREILTCRMYNIPQALYFKLRPGQQVQLSHTLNWIFAKNAISNWLMGAVKVGKVKLFGPKHRLADLTIEEFMYTEAAYERWLQSSKTEYLDTLFAVLYRRKIFFSLYRRKFDARHLAKQEVRATRLKNYVKKAVALNYSGCRNFIIDRHPNIWKAAADSLEKKDGHTLTNWAAIILDLAGDKFGTYEQTLKSNLWIVLADLDKKAKTVAEMEKPR